MVKDREEAQDIVQQCFIRVWEKRGRFRLGSRFSPWLYKIVTNLCLDYLRKRPALKLVSLSEPVGNPGEGLVRQIADKSPHAAQVLAHNELNEKLWEAISSLPQKYKEVFILRCTEKLSCKETAEIIGCPEGTVKRRVYEAKKILKRKMGEQGGSGE